MANETSLRSPYDEVRARAFALTDDERECLAVELALSVEEEPGRAEAWEAEVLRRLKAIDDGTAVLLSDEEFDALALADDD